MVPLPPDAYRALVALDEPFVPAAAPAPPEQHARLAHTLLELLADEPGTPPARRGGDDRALLRALLTVRPPGPLPREAVPALDALLGGERDTRPVVDASALPSIADAFPDTRYPAAGRTVLWRGDITTLAADAVVNAANSTLLGCLVPGHACIDNAIHAAAGPRLRDDCDAIVRAQGTPEPTGAAKVTRGYHLPARFVLHTVGPVVEGPVTAAHEAALASCYRSCLDVAASVGGMGTVAFCAISTGVFGYPPEAAAPVALATVATWLQEHPRALDRVVFDVFGPRDEEVYRDALRGCAG